MLDAKIKVGTLSGTGAAMNIECGFIPRYVKIINMNDAGALDPPTMEWIYGMAAATGVKLVGTTTAYSQLGSNGITAWAGAEPMAALSAGTVATTAGSAAITGSGTKFLTDLRVGDTIKSDFNGETLQIMAIASDTAATATAVAENTASGKTFKRVNGRSAGFTLGADADVNASGEAFFFMAIGDSN